MLWTSTDTYELHELDMIRMTESRTLQPLHFNLDMQEAAIDHNVNDLLVADTFDHSNPAIDYADAGGTDGGGHWFGQNHQWFASTQSTFTNAQSQAIVDSLIAGYMASPSHEANILDVRHDFAGISNLFSGNYTGDKGEFTQNGVSYNKAWVNTEDFGSTVDKPDVIVFAYDDLDNDHEFDIGEGLAGVTVTIKNAFTQATLTATTDNTGYASIELASWGKYNVYIGPGTQIDAVLDMGPNAVGHGTYGMNMMIDAENPLDADQLVERADPGYWGALDNYLHLASPDPGGGWWG